MCDGISAVIAFGKHVHNLPVLHTATNMSGNSSPILLEIAPHQRSISPLDGMIRKLPGKEIQRKFVLRHHQEAAGVFINAMHQSCAGDRYSVLQDSLWRFTK